MTKSTFIKCAVTLLLGVGQAYFSLAKAQDIFPQNEIIKVCDGVEEWPPFIYFDLEDKKSKDRAITGLTVEIFNEMLIGSGAKASYDLIPWKRCVSGIEHGEYHIALNAVYNESRISFALFSKPFYSLTPSLIYDKNRFPDGVVINNLEAGSLCGIRGYGYSTFNINENLINSNSKDYPQSIRILERKRCVAIVTWIEPFIGLLNLGNVASNLLLDYQTIGNAQSSIFRMMISKKYAFHKQLMKLIDNNIENMTSDGLLSKSIENLRSF